MPGLSPENLEHLLCGDCTRWTVPCRHCDTPGIGRCPIDGRYYGMENVCQHTTPIKVGLTDAE